MKKVSVIITTYMNDRYIGAAVESVLNQTFGDYELIIVDDGSTDRTRDVVSGFKDERIRYIWQEHSGLPASARNRGIGIATGRFIAFLDGDNTWHPDKLTRCIGIFEKDPAVDVLGHDANLMRDSDKKTFKRTFYGPYKDDIYKYFLLEGNSMDPSSVVMKRTIFSEDGFSFDEDKNLYTVEDYDLWLRLAKPQRYNFFYLPEPLTDHRVFEKSSTLKHIDRHALNTIYLLDRNFRDLDPGQKSLRQIIKKRKSQAVFGAALAFNYRRKFSESLHWHIKAIREYPLYWKPYLSIIASLFRIRLKYI